MKFSPCLLRCAVITSLAAASTAAGHPPVSADAVLAQTRERTGVPGIAAAVVRDGKIIASGVGGVREVGQPSPIQLSDPFLIASCTKRMTRLLLGRLAQAGKLPLDASLPQLLPGVKLRPEYEKVTVGDLINHTAGLPAYTRITPRDTPIIFELKGSPEQSRARLVEHVLMENPTGKVGQDFGYSNAGFVVLGHIAERAGGKPWETLIQDEVFQPLAIHSATVGFPTNATAANELPKGHERSPAGYAPATYEPPNVGVFAPAGAICLSIEDFARFAAAEVSVDAGRDTPFLGKPTAESLASLAPKNRPNRESTAFFGGQGTFTAACAVWPEKGLGIVVCTNAGGGDDVCTAAIEAMRAAFAPDIPPLAAAGGPGSGPKLGVSLRAEAGGLVSIENVIAGGLADQLGMKAGDEIVTLDGQEFKGVDPSIAGPSLRAPGAKLGIRRDGKLLEIQIPVKK